MEDFHANIHDILQTCSKIDESSRKLLQKYLSKQIWNSQDRDKLLDVLAKVYLRLSRSSCVSISKAFGPLTIELMHRCADGLNDANLSYDEAILHHEKLCILLSWLCSTCLPSLSEFTLNYLEKNGAPFKRFCLRNNSKENEVKKRKKMVPDQFVLVLEATYRLIMHYPVLLTFNWQWSALIESMKSGNGGMNFCGRFYLKKVLARVVGICDATYDSYNCNGEKRVLMLHCQVPCDNDCLDINSKMLVDAGNTKHTHTQSAIISSDLSSKLVSICGILLHKQHYKADRDTVLSCQFQLVVTKTLQPKLQALALAVSEGNAIVVEGPIGCGKTALIEHLGQITGHAVPPYFTKVQLSDETDSKTLSGTYICTNVPGEFKWQSGLLVEACQKGYWLLLEDIDRAPMDVISLLLPLIESGHLHIPGNYSENIVVSSSFRLFMTRRSCTSSSTVTSLGTSMILKHSTTVDLNEIPEDDLKQIIISKYSNIEPVADKLLIIYKILQETDFLTQYSAQRRPSTRDLLKWCQRVSHFISSHGPIDISTFVAMSAIDCFVASSPSPRTRLSMIEEITAHLNIASDKAEYYCYSYKPEIKTEQKLLSVGRCSLSRINTEVGVRLGRTKQMFAATRHSSVLLERIACCVESCEPVLLVGETGVGKTSALQYLAQETGRQLHVVNMSQQSSSGDLLGGYKPAQISHLVAPVREEFEKLFPETFARQQNFKFLTHIQTCYVNKRYNDLWQLMMHSSKAAMKRLSNQKNPDETMVLSWRQMIFKLNDLRLKMKSDSPIAFNFVEGKLSQCVERGDWLLLDEINLAGPDTLECLSGVLESESGSIILMERGDAKPITRHKEFRLFAAMNPATDVGKRNLSDGIRNRFTEIFVDEPTEYSDVATIVAYYLQQRTAGAMSSIGGIVTFYQKVREIANDKLVDGTGHKPHYSLRTLCRSLRYVVDNPNVPLLKALYEGFCLSFLTALDRNSHPKVVNLIVEHIVGSSNLKSIRSQPLPKPGYPSVMIEGHYIRRGHLNPSSDTNYIITASVKENLHDLASPVAYGKYPILIQGETSTGKTSLIKYLAAATGNKVIRINNHEHTDLQEYVGSYTSNKDGKLIFQDGPLVTAMREGYWIILDELNLAPTDILEALNRVLDDNRELFITETQEVVQAHPRFMLFATQNPSGLYGGRKVLSRAFRNRFVELHFDEIPTDELKTILQKRCSLAPSHCNKLVKVMLELQSRRKASGLFSGKHGFITLRDLFRWAERYRKHKVDSNDFYDWEQHLVDDGFLLLAGKVRKKEEEKVIEEVLEKHFDRSVNYENLFGIQSVNRLVGEELPGDFSHVVWTQPMRRLYVTLERALRFDEPILLIGETGGGKTTACQLISLMLQKRMFIINCHANTEAADFIGSLRPARHSDIDDKTEKESLRLFEWVDGPLVASMLGGHHILVDEISLADDSVLERLNSVLEPERTLVIPDKVSMSGNEDVTGSSSIVAEKGFQFLATMNPGGDYGKKELSPALRNRMTEIWCDVVNVQEDLLAIVEHNLHLLPLHNTEMSISNANLYAKLIVEFVTWFKSTSFGKRFVISVRDLITWANFMSKSCRNLDLPSAYVHAACLVYIDGLGAGVSGAFAAQSFESHSECLKFIMSQLSKVKQLEKMAKQSHVWIESEITGRSFSENQLIQTKTEFGIVPFSIESGSNIRNDDAQFCFTAHTTSANALRILRALQLSRPVLLEGSPGGGKTSLVSAIANAAGYNLVRINLSEQTDASDLFGADLPVENGKGGEFSWRDGPLLAAMKAGHWVVLDELNLASQSVLESLNSVFDHRGELYVPELSRYFHVNRNKTKIFACQNPVQEGGGRKGLPKSFLNRFTQVYVNNLSKSDLLFIIKTSFSKIPFATLEKMVEFNQEVYHQVVCNKTWGHKGSPWEFNLRDLTRWCQLVISDVNHHQDVNVGRYMYLIYSERLRSSLDREKMHILFEQIFGLPPYQPTRCFHITSDYIQIGNTIMDKSNQCFQEALNFQIMPSMLHPAESLMIVLNQNWPCILTGASGSGKSLLMKIVAGLTGHRLQILSTNSAMDAIELLGGFEQADICKKCLSLFDDTIKSLLASCHNCIDCMDSENELNRMQNLLVTAERLRECSRSIDVRREGDDFEQVCEEVEQKIRSLVRFAQNSLDRVVCECLQDCLNEFKKLSDIKNVKGTYEWSDSVLVKAMLQGDWLLVDSANFCSVSVLDRLNALLEPNGVLAITERGVIDGSITTIKPHEDFRLVFALDPSHGELSRAMRNRCVEIHLPSYNETEISLLEATNFSPHGGGLTWEDVDRLVSSKCGDADEERISQSTLHSFKQLADTSKFASKVEALKLVENMLKSVRHGIHRDQTSFAVAIPQRFHLSPPSPCVGDFVFRPSLSMVLHQFSVFKLIENLNKSYSLDYPSVVCSFLRTFIELSTLNDQLLRRLVIERFLPQILNNSEIASRLVQLFADMLECVSCDDSLIVKESAESHINDMPWDPRWNLQLLHHFNVFDAKYYSSCYKVMLKVVFIQLRWQEEAKHDVMNSTTRNRTPDEDAFMFGLAKSFSLKQIRINELPHKCLIYLLPLYEAWGKLVNDVLSDSSSLDGKSFIVSEGALRRVSFIWKKFMTLPFELSNFINWYLQLKREMRKYLDQFKEPNLNVCGWHNVISSLDNCLATNEDIQTELKIQNKFRSNLTGNSIQLFTDEVSWKVSCCYQGIRRDVTGFALNVVCEKTLSGCKWLDIHGIMVQMIQFMLGFNNSENKSNSHDSEAMDVDEEDHLSFLRRLCDELTSRNIPLSAKTQDLLKQLNLQMPSTDPTISERTQTTGHALGLSPLKVQSWPLNDFFQYLSELTLFTNERITGHSDIPLLRVVDVLQHQTDICLKEYFHDLAATKNTNSLFIIRRYLLSKATDWPLLSTLCADKADSCQEVTVEKISKFDGIGNLLRPCVSRDSFSVLYDKSAMHTHSSIAQIKESLWSGISVSLSEAREKLSQINSLSKTLWKNASLLTQLSCNDVTSLPNQLICCAAGVLESFSGTLQACGVIERKMQYAANQTFISQCEDLSSKLERLMQSGSVKSSQLLSSVFKLNSAIKLLSSLSPSTDSSSPWISFITETLRLCAHSTASMIEEICNDDHDKCQRGASRKLWILKCWKSVGEAWIWIGYLQVLFVVPRGAVDPIEKRKSKVQYLSSELLGLQCDMDVRNASNRNLTGYNLVSNDMVVAHQLVHPQIADTINYTNGLKKKIADSKRSATYRPDRSQFFQMSRDCYDFLSTIANLPSLQDLLNNLSALKVNDSSRKVEEKLQQSFAAFSRALNDRYAAYPDFVKPVQDAVTQMQFGLHVFRLSCEMNLAHCSLHDRFHRVGCSSSTLETFVIQLVNCQYVCEDVTDLISVVKCLEAAMSETEEGALMNCDWIVDTILTAVLVDLYQRVKTCSSYIDYSKILSLLETIVGLWNRRQELIEQKEAEKASLFKYKEKEHHLNEEEDTEEEFNSWFPDFQGDIADLMDDDKLNDHPTGHPEVQEKEVELSSAIFDLAALIHSEVVASHGRDRNSLNTSPLPLNNKKSKQDNKKSKLATTIADSLPNHLLPMLLSHQNVSTILKQTFATTLGCDVDHELTRYHLLACSKLKEYLYSENFQDGKKDSLNVYVDNLPLEASRCEPVLRDMRSTLTDKLLIEWPDHPVLNQLVIIIDRILSFSVTCSIMKFVTGLELLLSKSQEWESNACRSVSIKNHLEAVTSLVLDWRRLELKSWNRLLNDAEKKASCNTTKWWFYVYQLTEDALQQSHKDDYSNVVCNVVASLQKFIDSSTIAQYHGRVELLSVFHQHLLLKGRGRDLLSVAFFNLHQYYAQFLDANQSRIVTLKQPVEKELRDFVKISKWNDVNFYAVRDSVTKTHRNLFKLVKKYSVSLMEPVVTNVLRSTPAFAARPEDTRSRGHVICKRWNEIPAGLLNNMKPITDCLREMLLRCSAEDCTEITNVTRLPSIAEKLTKHCNGWMSDTKSFMPILVSAFEDTTSNIIENFVTLRNLQPSTPISSDKETREKRLSEAKHIQSRKRKALSDLFKLLRLVGLSYRKGLVWERKLDSKKMMLTLFPCPLVAPACEPDEISSDAISSGNQYFYKMVARWSSMLAALEFPNKEVGSSNLSRFRGFINHLLCLCINEREKVAKLSKTDRLLKETLSILNEYSSIKDCQLSNQNATLNAFRLCQNAIDSWMNSLIKFKELMSCCPGECDKDIAMAEPSHPHLHFPEVSSCSKEDELMKKIASLIQSEIDATAAIRQKTNREAGKYLDRTGNLKDGLVLFPSVLELARDSAHSINQSSGAFCNEMCKYFNSPGNSDHVTASSNKFLNSPLLADVLEGRNTVVSCYDKITSQQDKSETVSENCLLNPLNYLISKIMLSVQKLVKGCNKVEINSNSDELLEGHLVKLIIAQTNEYFRCLNVEDIQGNLLQIMKRVGEVAGNEENNQVISLTLHALLPVLSQYSSLVSQICLTSSVIQRSICKLTYVLSTAFAEVISKGFCPPAEFEEELAGDKGELKEVEDAGIGEGEGSKDVSDQIEEENQVEDTPGSEPQEQNDEDIPGEDNAIEMSNDFEGKFQDDAPMEQDENTSDQEEDLDKQMGDLGDEADADRLDERMWGSDEEEEEEEEQNDKKEEKGAGMDPEQSELAAKDNEVTDGQDNKKEQENIGDQSEFDPNEQDETHADEPSAPPEEIDLPDDLNIDDDIDDKDEENKKAENRDETDPEEHQEEVPESMDVEETEESTTPDADDEKEVEENPNDKGDISEEDKEPDSIDPQNEPDTESDNINGDDDQNKHGADEPDENVDKSTEDDKEQSKEEEEQQEDSDDSPSAPGKQLPAEDVDDADDQVRDKTSALDKQPTEEEVMQSETANQQVSQMSKEEGNDEKNQGSAPSMDQSGEESENMTSHNVTDTEQNEMKSVENERRMGHSDAKRTLGDSKNVPPTRLNVIEDLKEEDDHRSDAKKEADLYQHLSNDVKEYDKETRDAATEDQIKPQPIEESLVDDDAKDVPSKDSADVENDITMATVDTEDLNSKHSCEEASSVKNDEVIADSIEEETDNDGNDQIEDGNLPADNKDLPLSSIHTNVSDWEQSNEFFSITPEEIAKIRAEMEEHLRGVTDMEFSEAEKMWHQYQSVTQPLSQQLSEQLRLILEPTQMAKLKGDYRTGKRLNMRKVIPYIASGFRKDKIWLRRSKPSKREYQIMVAIDDSSSMSDNHTKQLAFEALAVISTALTTLEAGQLSVCNFGENTQLLHHFDQPFTDHSGAEILQRCSFKQEQTKVAKLLDKCVKFLKSAQANYTSSADPRLSQLLLIISDGRGLYVEGKDRVKAAVRAAKRAGIFLAFVVLDNPAMKDSILDIREPVFTETGEIKEIRSYMADFPFPFYVVIRNINALPETLSEALRQWFEIVTSGN